MPIRRRTSTKTIGNYFVEDKPLELVSSGSTLLNCILGGGYPLGRVVNIVGDKSTGKTLLAIEAIINFFLQYEDGLAYYHEVEAAFDKQYARALSMPIHKIEFTTDDLDDPKNDGTIEFLFETLVRLIAIHRDNHKPGIVVVDSNDAMSTRVEKKRGIDEGSYKTDKAALSSEVFRRLVTDLSRTRILLIIISQVRDNIGVTFGRKHKRNGGRALDFYASQVIWLSELGKIEKTIQGISRPISTNIRAKCDKNKVSLPFRQCDFPILFGYGIDDVSSCLEWLSKIDALDELEIAKTKIKKEAERIKKENDIRMIRTITRATRRRWKEIETKFIPEYRKYASV